MERFAVMIRDCYMGRYIHRPWLTWSVEDTEEQAREVASHFSREYRATVVKYESEQQRIMLALGNNTN